MAINDHPAVRYEQDRSGTWGNAQVKTVKVDMGVRADELVTRIMKIYPSMRINSVFITVTDAVTGAMDVGWVKGELDPTASGFAAADGDVDYFFDNVSIAAVADFNSRASAHHAPLEVDDVGYITVQNKAAIVAANVGVIWFHIEFEYIGSE